VTFGGPSQTDQPALGVAGVATVAVATDPRSVQATAGSFPTCGMVRKGSAHQVAVPSMWRTLPHQYFTSKPMMPRAVAIPTHRANKVAPLPRRLHYTLAASMWRKLPG
jgi:hypothetical protein